MQLPVRAYALPLVLATAGVMLAGVATTAPAQVAVAHRESHATHYRTVRVDGVDIFYREAGPADAPGRRGYAAGPRSPPRRGRRRRRFAPAATGGPAAGGEIFMADPP